MVALAVDSLLPPELLLSVGAVGNVGDRALVTNAGANTIGIVALVGNDDGAFLEPVEKRGGADDVVVVAGRDQEPDWAPFRIDPRVDLRGESASASTHTTNSTLFLTPEAC